MTTGAVFTDTSYFQSHVNDSYPHQWISARVCDGTFRDPAWSANYEWAKSKPASRIVGVIGYCVYRPGADVFGTYKSMVGTADRRLVVMIDVESWGGQIRGDHSASITALAERFADWLGDRRRVIAYANQGDFAYIYPHRPPWLKVVVAGYSSVKPVFANMIGWQYSDGDSRWPVPAGLPRSTPPFGHCDHNVFPGLTATQAATALGVGPKPAPVKPVKYGPTDPKWSDTMTQDELIAAVETALSRHEIRVDYDNPKSPRVPMDRMLSATNEHVNAVNERLVKLGAK